MSRAVLCPVCHGKGKLYGPDATYAGVKCHGCDGKGWVEVSEAHHQFYPKPKPWTLTFQPYKYK